LALALTRAVSPVQESEIRLQQMSLALHLVCYPELRHAFTSILLCKHSAPGQESPLGGQGAQLPVIVQQRFYCSSILVAFVYSRETVSQKLKKRLSEKVKAPHKPERNTRGIFRPWLILDEMS